MSNICNIDFSQALNLYIHIPTLTFLLFLGMFVFLSDSKNAINRNLFAFILILIFWVLNDLLQWMTFDENVMLFFSRLSILSSFSVLFLLFFSFAFSGKKIKNKQKLFFSLPFLPIILLSFSKYNTFLDPEGNCDVSLGYLYIYLVFILIFYVAWSVKILLDFYKINKKDKKIKNQVKIITAGFIGAIVWIVAILGLTSFALSIRYVGGDNISLFISIGMLILVSSVSYAITKYQLLNIKVILTQVLVIALLVLIGSQFFLIQNRMSMILTGITFFLSVGFGYMLIKSVQKEVERKEELQKMADSLAIANDKLRILDKAKTEFISIASHQLRTPVTAIKGFSSLLLEGSYGEVSAGVKGALEKVFVSSERLVNLIEDLLNVSRIESGRLTFTFEMGSVNDVLQELYDSFILVAKAKKFYLDLKVPENPLPKIKMDAAKIRELISNFIDNAFKYTEKGGVTVKAEIRESGVVIDEDGFVKEGEKSPYGKVVRVTVSDTGIGVPREEIPSLFKKFSRGKDVSRLHVGGTGLGLFVGKAIADAHHGATWVESDGAGKGSRFIIEIPINIE